MEVWDFVKKKPTLSSTSNKWRKNGLVNKLKVATHLRKKRYLPGISGKRYIVRGRVTSHPGFPRTANFTLLLMCRYKQHSISGSEVNCMVILSCERRLTKLLLSPAWSRTCRNLWCPGCEHKYDVWLFTETNCLLTWRMDLQYSHFHCRAGVQNHSYQI